MMRILAASQPCFKSSWRFKKNLFSATNWSVRIFAKVRRSPLYLALCRRNWPHAKNASNFRCGTHTIQINVLLGPDSWPKREREVIPGCPETKSRLPTPLPPPPPQAKGLLAHQLQQQKGIWVVTLTTQTLHGFFSWKGQPKMNVCVRYCFGA
jgi:hypothetical protein